MGYSSRATLPAMAEIPLLAHEAPDAIPATAAEMTFVKVRRDGPNVFTGDVALAGGRPATGRTTLVLCRCGESRNKPHCDGTHSRQRFHDAGTLPADVPPGTRATGPVMITPRPNGPLECHGPLAVEGADGRVACVSATLLCRCGHSRTKPFCDGSHSRVGFVG
jgi:CDGSH-type Zn-finger protein